MGMALASGTRKLASGRVGVFVAGKLVGKIEQHEEAAFFAAEAALHPHGKPVVCKNTFPIQAVSPEMGTYTIVRADGTYRTLQVAPAAWVGGATVISYLSGPDNELSYTSCAFLKENGRFNVFRKFKTDSQLVRDLNTLVTCQIGEAHERFLGEAEAYALRSSRCMRCGHKLTVPASLHRGLGPVCAGIEGV